VLVLARLTVIRRDAGAETIGGVPIPPVVALHISARDVHPTSDSSRQKEDDDEEQAYSSYQSEESVS